MGKTKYYSLKNILAYNAVYNMVIGERSNGKTFSVLEYGLKEYRSTGKQMAILRRWADDFTGKRGSVMFDGLVSAGTIKRITNGEWTGVYYYASKWYLCRYEDNQRITDERPFAFGFSLSAMEHDKSTAYPDITTVLFDEFLTRTMYLQDEFILFMNVLSTIIRDRNDVKIFMLGNTVNKYCPYFAEMGLSHVKTQKPGSIDLYQFGDSRLTVAVEYAKPNEAGKESDMYFAFDNPKLSMITGGAWEIDLYPHLPRKYRPADIRFIYFIQFSDALLQCEVIQAGQDVFTYIHPKTTDLRHSERDLIYTTEYSPKPNFRRKITKPVTDIEKRIVWFFQTDKVFYSDNETGEVVRNYLNWCNGKG